MIIAFSGFRGSGKTTIAKLVLDYLHDQKISHFHIGSWLEQQDRRDKIFFFFYLWRFFSVKYFSIYWTGNFSLYAIYFPLMIRFGQHLLNTGQIALIIHDTETLQQLNKHGKHKFASNISWYQRQFIQTSGRAIIVSMRTSARQALARWESRDNLALSYEQKAQYLDSSKKWQNEMDRLIGSMSSSDKVNVLIIENKNSPKENATLIINQIINYL